MSLTVADACICVVVTVKGTTELVSVDCCSKVLIKARRLLFPERKGEKITAGSGCSLLCSAASYLRRGEFGAMRCSWIPRGAAHLAVRVNPVRTNLVINAWFRLFLGFSWVMHVVVFKKRKSPACSHKLLFSLYSLHAKNNISCMSYFGELSHVIFAFALILVFYHLCILHYFNKVPEQSTGHRLVDI